MNENHSEALPKAPLDNDLESPVARLHSMDIQDGSRTIGLGQDVEIKEQTIEPEVDLEPVRVISNIEHSQMPSTEFNTPEPLLRPRLATTIEMHPQTATVISINPEHLEQMRRENERREDEIASQNQDNQRLRKLFSQNMLYSKPNIAVVQQMASLSVFALFFMLAFFTAEVSFEYMIVPYAFDAITEGIVIFLFSRCSFLVNHYKHWILVPFLAKVLSVAIVASDLGYHWGGSAYFAFLPIITALGVVIPKVSYAAIKPMPACLYIFVAICELLGMIQLGVGKGAYYSTLFIILFYYFLVTFFFNLIGFLSALLSICVGLCKCFKQFRYKVFIVQFLLGADNIMAVVVCMEFSNWIYYQASLNGLKTETRPINQERTDQIAQLKRSATQSDTKMKVLSAVLLGYSLVRNVVLFFCSKDELSAAQQTELRSGMLIGQAPAPHGANVAPGTPYAPHNLPRVEQPSTKDAILNLFRVNATYFSTAGQASKPAVTERKEEGGDLCTICIAEPPNCIILDCRHGGVCKTCAFDMLKKSNACPFCRAPIAKVCVVLKVAEDQYRVIEEIKL